MTNLPYAAWSSTRQVEYGVGHDGSGSGNDIDNDSSSSSNNTTSVHLTANMIRPVNALTRFSSEPGRLQYHEYIRYLKHLGHTKEDTHGLLARTDTSSSPGSRTGLGLDSGMDSTQSTPMNSNLQYRAADHDDNDCDHDTDNDMTDWRAEQCFWHLDDLPDLLYVFEKPSWWLERSAFKEPPKKPYPIYGKTLRDIPILPDHISSSVEGWRIETWMRMDARVSYPDIYDRIHPRARPKHHSTVQMRVERFRHGKDDRTEGFKSVGWISGKNQAAHVQGLKEDLVLAGVDLRLNTTRGLSWGLVDRALGEEGGRIVVPENVRRALKSTVDPAGVDLRPVLGFGGCSTSPQPSPLPSRLQDTFRRYQGQEQTVHPVSPTTRGGGSDGHIPTPLVRSAPVVPIFQHDRTVPNPPPQLRVHLIPEPASQLQQVLTRTLPFRPRPVLAPFSSSSSSSPHLSSSQQPIRIKMSGRQDLILKTEAERANLSREDHQLLSTWYPAGSEGRSRQLEFILHPRRALHGFVDNHGYYPSIQSASTRTKRSSGVTDEPGDFEGTDEANYTDVDVIYNVE